MIWIRAFLLTLNIHLKNLKYARQYLLFKKCGDYVGVSFNHEKTLRLEYLLKKSENGAITYTVYLENMKEESKITSFQFWYNKTLIVDVKVPYDCLLRKGMISELVTCYNILASLWPNRDDQMKYVSIDIETTGLDPSTCQILEFAAVIDDLENPKPLDELPRFQCYVKHVMYRGQAYGIMLNAKIFEVLAHSEGVDLQNVKHPWDVIPDFKTFLSGHGIIKVNPAGKNFAGFDNLFLKWLKHYETIKFGHRVLDPGSMFVLPTDSAPPDLKTCLKRAGYPNREVAHTALEDALDVIRCIRGALLIGEDGKRSME